MAPTHIYCAPISVRHRDENIENVSPTKESSPCRGQRLCNSCGIARKKQDFGRSSPLRKARDCKVCEMMTNEKMELPCALCGFKKPFVAYDPRDQVNPDELKCRLCMNGILNGGVSPNVGAGSRGRDILGGTTLGSAQFV